MAYLRRLPNGKTEWLNPTPILVGDSLGVDWSKVVWHVYTSPKGIRATYRELTNKQMRKGEKRIGREVGVSLRTAMARHKAKPEPQ